MTDSPHAAFSREIDRVRTEVQILDVHSRFRAQLSALERLEESVYRLPSRLQVLHDRKVLYRREIGQEVVRMTTLLRAALKETHARAERWQQQMQGELLTLQYMIEEMEAAPQGEALARVVARLEASREQATRGAAEIESVFSALIPDVAELEQRVKRLEWAAEALAQATFRLRAGEVLVDASRATTAVGRGEVAEGVLFLSDQRLLFERRQQLPRGPRFLPFRRTRQVEMLLLDEPLAQIVQVDVGRPLGSATADDTLNIKFVPEVSTRKFCFDLGGYQGLWRELIETARTREREARHARRAS